MRRPVRSWKEGLKDLFHMHRGERRGLLILAALCAVAMAWVTWEQWLRPLYVEDESHLLAVWAELADPSQTHDPIPAGRMARPTELFPFDPNGLPVEQWRRLGLSERQAAAIHRYEAKGGRFRTKQDLARMRVVDTALFRQWEPFVQLPDRAGSTGPTLPSYPDYRPSTTVAAARTAPAARPERTKLELNASDSTALVALPGIGPAFARAILKYRDRLGGFVDLGQLGEVRLLQDKPDALAQIQGMLMIDAAAVRKIPINQCTSDELGRHPYVGWKTAKALVAYRQQHGPFPDLPAMKGCVLVSDSMLARLAPYITVP
jgi:competence protein ComEA